MELERVLRELDEAGVVLELAADGQRIRWKASSGAVRPELLEGMRRWKPALLRLVPPSLAAWKTEVQRWPACFRAAWCGLAESYEHAGYHRAAAEYLAWLDLKEAASLEDP